MREVKNYKLKVIRNWILLIAAFVFAFPEYTFSQKFTASVNNSRVAVGEAFQVSFSLNTSGGHFTPPSFNDFEVYSGPNQSSSMQYVNGSMSQSITLSYIIAAKREGKFTIGSASIMVDGKKIESNPITIEAVRGATPAQQSNSQQGTSNQSQPTEDFYAKAIISKSKAYQGEQIEVNFKIYTRLNVVSIADLKIPDHTGFWSQKITQSQYTLVDENIGGKVYKVILVEKAFLFPQRTGTIEIEPMEVKCIVRKRSNRGPQSIFDQFFGGGYEDVAVTAKSKPIKIEVMPLPEDGKPEGFSGAVGNFSFKAQVAKEKVTTNDAINLNLTISGRGNLKLLDPIKINFPDNFEVYDPKINENISTTANGVSGSKNFEYLVIPRREGTYTIAPLNFSYFDPEKKKYVTLPSPEFNLTVEKGENKDESGGNSVITSVAKEEVKQLNNDIRYIKTSPVTLVQRDTFFFGSALFYAGITTPLLAFISFILLRKKYISYNSNQVLVKNRKANKIAKKRLATAEKYIQGGEKEKFYDEIFRALYGYLSDKLNIPVAELSKEKIAYSLAKKNSNTQLNQKLMATLDNCEYARYAPSAVSNDLNEIYSNTSDLISQMEETL